MALAGDEHVCIAIEPQLHRPARLARQDGCCRCDERGLALFSAEATAHAAALHRHAVGMHSKRMRHDMLDFGRVLSGAVNQDRAVFLGKRDGDLAFEIEVILPADRRRALQPMSCSRQHLVWLAAHDALRWKNVAARRQCRANVEDSGERFVFHARGPRRLPGRKMRGRRHREQGLAGVLNQALRENRVVVNDTAVVVLPRYVCGQRYGVHTRHRQHRRNIELNDAPVRNRAEPEGCVERVRRQRNVIAVECLAAHMQVRAIVNLGETDAHVASTGSTSSTRNGAGSSECSR